MLRKTLLSTSAEGRGDLTSVEKMGYTAIQVPISSPKGECGLYAIHFIDQVKRGEESPDFYVWDFSTPEQLSDLEALVEKYGEKLLVEIKVSVRMPFSVIERVYQLRGGESVFLTFPISFQKRSDFLSPRPAHSIVQELRAKGHEVKPRRDLCPPNLSLENSRYIEEGFSVVSESKFVDEPEFSVVIPLYENKVIAFHSLDNLSQIFENEPCFEVVVVDDGSFDGFLEEFETKKHRFKMPITLLSRPRLKRRRMGDFYYGAGISRNIGAGFARGEKVLFLDCDILIGPEALKVLREEMTSADLVMCQREHLSDEQSLNLPSYKEAELFNSVEVDFGYWRSFYEKAKDWNSWGDKWRYVCTHSLCVRKKMFHELGGFANNYNVYGYEDVDFGYKVAQQGGKFLLSKNRVFHLSPGKERSEFFKVHYKKMSLLSFSSRIFYFNTLDNDVFLHTEHFWGSSRLIFVLYVLKKKLSRIPFLSKFL